MHRGNFIGNILVPLSRHPYLGGPPGELRLVPFRVRSGAGCLIGSKPNVIWGLEVQAQPEILPSVWMRVAKEVIDSSITDTEEQASATSWTFIRGPKEFLGKLEFAGFPP